jgi:hypothetical protein
MDDFDRTTEAAERLTDAIFHGDLVAAIAAIKAGVDVATVLPRFPETPLAFATRWYGNPEIVQALISAGAPVPADALESLGEDEVTDWMIESEEEEQEFARTAEILLSHGADPNVRARNGLPLIEFFPEDRYPFIHRILADALQSRKATDRNA